MKVSQKLISVLSQADIKHLLYLPCDRVKSFLAYLEKNKEDLPFSLIPLTREEEGVGISFGLNLGKERNVLLIQSSGFGNIITALVTLTQTYSFPLVILVSLRGFYKEKIYPQILMGRALIEILKALNLDYYFIDKKEDINLIKDIIKQAYEEKNIKVALLSPSLFEGEVYENVVYEKERCFTKKINYEKTICNPDMTRYEFFLELLSLLKDYKLNNYKDFAFFVNIGFPSREFYFAQKSLNLNFPTFYMLGSLGLVSSIALGFSLTKIGKSYKVLSLDGDGSLLMNTGTLSTCSCLGKDNFSIICIDNGTWGSTGDQEIYTFNKVDLELVAKGMGFEKTVFINYKKDINRILKYLENKLFYHVIVKPKNEKVGNIEKDVKSLVLDFWEKVIF